MNLGTEGQRMVTLLVMRVRRKNWMRWGSCMCGSSCAGRGACEASFVFVSKQSVQLVACLALSVSDGGNRPNSHRLRPRPGMLPGGAYGGSGGGGGSFRGSGFGGGLVAVSVRANVWAAHARGWRGGTSFWWRWALSAFLLLELLGEAPQASAAP